MRALCAIKHHIHWVINTKYTRNTIKFEATAERSDAQIQRRVRMNYREIFIQSENDLGFSPLNQLTTELNETAEEMSMTDTKNWKHTKFQTSKYSVFKLCDN